MCELNISPVGCFNDNHQALRPLPHLVDSHRDPTSHAYHGSTIDWKNFESSIRKYVYSASVGMSLKVTAV